MAEIDVADALPEPGWALSAPPRQIALTLQPGSALPQPGCHVLFWRKSLAGWCCHTGYWTGECWQTERQSFPPHKVSWWADVPEPE